jgi:RNA polymerase sigma-70 factor (ECF subfamily)
VAIYFFAKARRRVTSTSVSESKREDAELLARLRAGDRAACAACVDTHADGLYRMALRMLGDADEAEDVVQDTFFSAFRALDSFEARAQLGTWLYRIAYNEVLMRLRKHGRTVPLDEEGEDTTASPTGGAPETPEDALERQETGEVLDAAIRELPPALQAVFVLRDLEGLSTEETASVLDIGEALVKVRLHRARRALRARLGEYLAPSEGQDQMTCPQLVRYLSDYIDRNLDEPLERAAYEHIVTCPRCHVALDTTGNTITLYDMFTPHVIPSAHRTRLMTDLQAAFRERFASK